MTECTVALEGIGTIEGLGVVDREWMSVVWRVVLEGIGNLPTMVSYNKVHTHKFLADNASMVSSEVHACSWRPALLLP